MEAPFQELFQQNVNRQRRVPRHSIEHMLERWQVPDVTEAWMVEWWQGTETRLR